MRGLEMRLASHLQLDLHVHAHLLKLLSAIQLNCCSGLRQGAAMDHNPWHPWHQLAQKLRHMALGLDVMVQNEASITDLRQQLTAVQRDLDDIHEHYQYMHASMWHRFPNQDDPFWAKPVTHTANWVTYENSFPLMPLRGECVYHANPACESLKHVPPGSILEIPGGLEWLWWRHHIWKPCDSCWPTQVAQAS